MTGDRGISTVVDVAVGLLLVGAAVGVVAGINPPADASPDTSGSVLLGTRMEVSSGADDPTARVTGAMGSLIADAALAGTPPVSSRDRAFRRAVRSAVSRRLSKLGVPFQVVGFCRQGPMSASIVAGPDVPPDRPVRATVYEVPPPEALRNETPSGRCDPAVVVRRWSP
jgi:hypothetical protein